MYKDIDEAIREHRAVARKQRKRASEPHELYPNIYRKCAEEHEQLVEWLEELKSYKEKELKHIHDILPPVPNCKFFDVEKCYRDEHDKQIRADTEEEAENRFNRVLDDEKRISYQQGRQDAIDEFVNFINTMPTYENEYGEIMPMPIEMMAEQLKESKE